MERFQSSIAASKLPVKARIPAAALYTTTRAYRNEKGFIGSVAHWQLRFNLLDEGITWVAII